LSSSTEMTTTRVHVIDVENPRKMGETTPLIQTPEESSVNLESPFCLMKIWKNLYDHKYRFPPT